MIIGQIIVYTKKMDEMVAFYRDHFGFAVHADPADRIVELAANDGPSLLLHPAAKSQKMGQVLVKLVFDVEDVPAMRDRLIQSGLAVGPLLDGGGYAFANLKDPSGNSVQISARAFRAP
ncbi:MAG: glyoxalase [Rhodobacteraceae bacterium]|nr:glyoxalase [Paracoccaceae bacterium]